MSGQQGNFHYSTKHLIIRATEKQKEKRSASTGKRKSFSFQFRRISLWRRIFIIFIVRNFLCEEGIIKLKYPWDSAKLSLRLSRISCRARPKTKSSFSLIIFGFAYGSFLSLLRPARGRARACRDFALLIWISYWRSRESSSLSA